MQADAADPAQPAVQSTARDTDMQCPQSLRAGNTHAAARSSHVGAGVVVSGTVARREAIFGQCARHAAGGGDDVFFGAD